MKKYSFDKQYETWVLGSCFRNLNRIKDIDEKYPDFVDDRNQAVFEYIKNGMENNEILAENEIIPKQKKREMENSFILYLMELDNLVVSDADSLFYSRLQKAREEKARQEALRVNLDLQKTLIQNNNNVKKTLAENIEILKDINDAITSTDLNKPASANTQMPNDLKFPYEVMDGMAGDFAEIYYSHLESCKEFFYFAFLTCLGSIFGHIVTIENELAPQPRLYTLLIGQSADTHKSTTLQKTINIFQKSIAEFKTSWGINSAEGLAQILTKPIPDFMNNTQSLLLVFDEFKTFISKAKIENSVLLPMVTSLFESNIYESNTSLKQKSIQNAYLSILAASTIETYETMWTQSFLNIGFLNRILLIPGETQKKFSSPPIIENILKQTIINAIWDTLKYVNQRCYENKFIIPFAEEARALYQDWYMKLPRSIYAKRLDTIALRLMALLTINVQKEKIDKEIIDKIIKIMNWQLKIREAYDPIDSENAMAGMEQAIRRCLKRKAQGLKDRELKQQTNANRVGLWIYKTALNNLLEAKEISYNNKKYCIINY